MADETRVRMTALRYHTYDNHAYDEGETYEAEAHYVDTLEACHLARRATDASAASAPEPNATAAKKSAAKK